MNNQRSLLPDPHRSRLRATVARIERQISSLPRWVIDDESSRDSLLAAFGDLVEQLALGPEPEVRQCPSCGHTGMRAATRCGYCWTPLAPYREGDAV